MKTILVFDIETIPDASGLRRLGDYDEHLSDQEIVEIAKQERLDKGQNDFFPLYLQKIVAISCVIRRTLKDGSPQFKVGTLGKIESSEGEIIQEFYQLIDRYTPQLVSWNGSGFDLPVLNYRALVNQVTASRFWEMGESQDYDSKEFKYNNYIARYHLRHLDLMDLLAFYQSKANAPLDSLAKLCGFPGKMGMDGSQVWPAYLEGKLPEIRRYCETDVANTYLMYCRFQLLRGAFSKEEYLLELEFVKKNLLQEASNPDGSHWQEYLSGFTNALS
ncbi:3'-5' exonuclease [Polynucleobacter rarus]|jgi:predicted PolB exonuclease-like 3'-5' exonuclease|uniref:3'-5' exonuclease n=1 Tax=Polynucleobacter rarus TaxID=556055 RepID=UPI000D3EA6F5|nr:3'-5' exonuclease [Polynucleobacter rarus]